MSDVLAFHYGNFYDHLGDGTRANAAKNGRIYADTLTSEIPSEYGTFTMSGHTSGQKTTYSWTPKITGEADILIVAGGGGGGGTIGGGGGAGGLIYKTNQDINHTLSYTIEVGDGGQGGNGWSTVDTVGKPGNNSVYGTYTAVGGGGGYSYNYDTSPDGGSGGGGAYESATGGTGNQPDGYGNNGGGGGNTNFGAGGGGALSKGGNVIDPTGGVGGVGMDLSHRFGSNYGDDGWFSGGGGGGVRSGSGRVNGVGGKGGGGNGTTSTVKAENGYEHSGGGGGGGGYHTTAPNAIIGGHGGSGIVLIGFRYNPVSPASVPGLTGWYTAYSAELSSGSVNKWNDLSGNGNHVESGSFTGSVKRADPNDSTLTNRNGVETDYFGSRIVVFTYGNFSSTLGHTSIDSAAKAGVICANTSSAIIPPHFGTFTMSGTTSGQTTYSWSPPGDCYADILVVAGGGGGGGVIGGGGGGGGLISKKEVLTGKDINIKVGDGGLGATGWNTTRQDGKIGKDSVFGTLTAKGGGGGVHHGGATATTTKDGGSGGGGANMYSGVGGNTTQSSESGDSGTYGYGHDGGDNGDGNWGSGGGGAGGAGGNTDRSTYTGKGGIGKYIKFARNYGDGGWFAGGGSGGSRDRGTISNGGLGGGAMGTKTSSLAGHGQEHTGGGGGGGGYNGGNSNQIGGNGGSGVVIVKFSLLYGKGRTEYPFLYGTTTDGLRFPTSMMDTSSDYTLFHVARYYKSSGTPSRKRIFDGVTSNWLSGFYDGKSGVANHGGWLTAQADIHGDNWLVSTDQKDLYRSNGVDRTISGSGSISRQLSINYGNYTGELSDWAVAEVIVYNRELSMNEYLSVESYLRSKYFRNHTIPSSGELSGMLINSVFYNGDTGNHGYPISLGRLGTGIGNTLNTRLNSSDFRNLRVSGALDSLSTSLLPTIAYGFRKLLGVYTGPQVRIKRDSDNVEADLYMDSSGTITHISGSTETDYLTWLNGATGYIHIWYDQSGGGRHATRTRRDSNSSFTEPPARLSSGDTTLHVDMVPASDDFLEFDNVNLGTHDYTWVMAMQTPTATSRWRTQLRGHSRHHYFILQDDGTLVGLYDNTAGGFSNTGVNHTPGNKDVYSCYAGGGQTVIRHNGDGGGGGGTISKQLPDFWNQRMHIGYPGQGFGKMFEMIFYAGAQSASFVESVEAIVDDVL
jgi:hypothetical protein